MERLLDVIGGKNFRDLGGYITKDGWKVKSNKIVRSGSLAELTNADLEMLQNYGVRQVIDFRTSNEQQKNPDRVPKKATHLAIPLFEEGTHPEIPTGKFHYLYNHLITSSDAKKAYLRVFEELLNNKEEGESVLFHCLGGKDRTGLAAIYILSVLGVSEEDILKDYMLTNFATKGFIASHTKELEKKGMTPEEFQHSIDSIKVSEEYFEKAMALIDHEYGSLERYIKNEIGLSDRQRDELRAIYLEK